MGSSGTAKGMPAAPKHEHLPDVLDDGSKRTEENHDAATGRFKKGNRASAGSHWRAEIRKQLGDLANDPLTRKLANESKYLFRALMRDLPVDGASVSALVASRARATVLSAWFAAESARAGLTSDRGMKLLDLSLKLDARAERLSVTTIDIAQRQAKGREERRGLAGLMGLGDAGSKSGRPLLGAAAPNQVVVSTASDPESDKE